MKHFSKRHKIIVWIQEHVKCVSQTQTDNIVMEGSAGLNNN